MSTTPRRKTVKMLDAQLRRCLARIAVERDKLRELLSEANSIEEDCTEAIDDMIRAADTLSKYL